MTAGEIKNLQLENERLKHDRNCIMVDIRNIAKRLREDKNPYCYETEWMKNQIWDSMRGNFDKCVREETVQLAKEYLTLVNCVRFYATNRTWQKFDNGRKAIECMTQLFPVERQTDAVDQSASSKAHAELVEKAKAKLDELRKEGKTHIGTYYDGSWLAHRATLIRPALRWWHPIESPQALEALIVCKSIKGENDGGKTF